MGLAKIALELLYIQSVLKEIGHEFDCDIDLETGKHEAHKLAHKMIALQHGATEIGTDNSGAFDLCHRDTQGKHSRHVERKMFKMRELAHSGKVKLKLIPTAEMSADMLTKALDDRTFLRHRRTVMNDLA